MNPRIKNLAIQILSDNWYTLKKATFDYLGHDGQWHNQQREAYDRGNGATVLLMNPTQQTVILTRQFRLPTYLNGNPTGMLIESCAGLLDADTPEICVQREAQEETGYEISHVRRVFQAYMSPGSVTEVVRFFVAQYDKSMQISAGGGLAHEHENIEVLELDFAVAYAMIGTGEICDGKTIMLLQYAKIHGLTSSPSLAVFGD